MLIRRLQNTNPYLFGNTTLLGGNVVTDQANLILPMNPGNLNSTNNAWFIDIWLPAGVPVEYQYVMKTANGTLFFQNMTQVAHPSACGGPEVFVYDSPGFPDGVVNATTT
jgi:hypothetical protein